MNKLALSVLLALPIFCYASGDISGTDGFVALVENISHDEGFSPHVYKDTQGVDTIGYGTSLKDGITEHEGKLLLISRLKSYIKDIGIAVPFFLDLPSPAQIVLIDLAYQVGTHGLLKYEDMLKALAKRDYETAAQEIENSKEALETPHRAKRLAAALRSLL